MLLCLNFYKNVKLDLNKLNICEVRVMKTAVIYQSKTGYTKKYAEWVAAELSADLFEGSQVTINKLLTYDTLIYGGGLYAVGINGVKLITQSFDKIKDKKIIVFATGLSLASEKVITEVKNRNFTSEQQKNIQFYYFRGGFEYRRLGIIDKLLMNLLKTSIQWKQQRNQQLSADDAGILEVFDKSTDYTEKSQIGELINWIKS